MVSPIGRGLAIFLVVTTVLGSSGCEPGGRDAAMPTGVPSPSAPSMDTAFLGNRGEFITRPLVRPTLRVTGPFEPGKPFLVTATAIANANVALASLDLLLPDDTIPASRRHVAVWNGALSRGSMTAEADIPVTLAAPGYYRLSLRAQGTPLLPTRSPDTVLVQDWTTTYIVLVDSLGGRLDVEYDTTVSRGPGRSLAFGSYGPFASPAVITDTKRSRVLAAGSTYSGLVRFQDFEAGGNPPPLSPVQNGYIQIRCYLGSTTFTSNTTTDNAGMFSATFPLGCTSAEARVTLIDGYSSVLGGGGVPIAAWMDLVPSQTVDYRLVNDYAYVVYADLARIAPLAASRFGRTRPRVSAWVSASDDDYGPKYVTDDDRIKSNFSQVLHGDGDFITAHEYGHAFHWRAIEHWRSGPGCTDHSLGQAISLPCAFVEGFADFFGFWLVGDELTQYGFNDYDAEVNVWKDNGNGVIIEGAVAAMLYDMVDSDLDPNGPNNETGDDDDTLAWPGSYVADLMRLCSVTTTQAGTIPPVPLTYNNLDGTDELLYCAENSLAARSAAPSQYQNSWRVYNSFAESITEPASWSASKVRSLWLWNLYQIGGLP